MTNFNKTQIKDININFGKRLWNPQTHNILLSYDPNYDAGFSVKIVSIYDTQPITDLKEAEQVLKKFRIK
jgi:hypothetical protein